MINIRKTWWLWLVLAGLCIAGIILYVQYVRKESNPCLTETVDVLVGRYPQLKELKEKQQTEMAKLLAFHRQLDLNVNLEMSNEQVSPEQALRLSLIQLDQVATLRKNQAEAFNSLCLESVAKAKQ